MGALSRTINYLKRNGFAAAWSAVCEELEKKRASGDHPYCYDAPARSVLEAQRLMAGALYARITAHDRAGCGGKKPGIYDARLNAETVPRPLFSVITPCYNTPPLFFLQLLNSVAAQTFPFWELILADAGEGEALKELLEEWLGEKEKEKDQEPAHCRETALSLRDRIRYIRLEENRGISENTNAGIREAKGDYLALLDHDDLLTPDALYEMARGIMLGKKRSIQYQMLFSDEDKCDKSGKMFHTPHKKENYNLDLLLSNNYICHFLVFKKGEKAQLLRKEYDGAQDYDLVLRLSQSINAQEILHIPRVLYHWRISENSSADNAKVKSYAYDAGERVLQEFMQSNGIKYRAISKLPHLGFYRIDYNEDLFSARQDVAMIGGPVWRKNTIWDGIRADGHPLFPGLKKGYSGPIHRAALQQDAFSLHPGNVRIRPELQNEWTALREKLTEENAEEGFDEFCRSLRRRGYRLLYDPRFNNTDHTD